jgi:hypothetical protein
VCAGPRTGVRRPGRMSALPRIPLQTVGGDMAQRHTGWTSQPISTRRSIRCSFAWQLATWCAIASYTRGISGPSARKTSLPGYVSFRPAADVRLIAPAPRKAPRHQPFRRQDNWDGAPFCFAVGGRFELSSPSPMAQPTHFNCPHCTFAFRPGDPRVAVPEGQRNRVIACPGCRTPIRVWGPGGPPRGIPGYVIAIAIVIGAIFIFYRLS